MKKKPMKINNSKQNWTLLNVENYLASVKYSLIDTLCMAGKQIGQTVF